MRARLRWTMWNHGQDRVIPPSRRHLSRKERMTMSPIEKWLKYGRFPWELVTHILVVAVSVSYVILHNIEFSQFVNANERSFRSSLQNTDVGPLGQTAIYTVSGLVEHIGNATSTYFNYSVTNIGEVTIEPVVDLKASLFNGTTAHYNLTAADPLGPLGWFPPGSVEQREFVNELRTLQARYKFANTLHATPRDSPQATWGPYHTMDFLWTCEGEYDFSDDSETTYRVRITASVQSGKVPQLYALDISLVLLCSLSILLSCRSLWRSYGVFCYAKRRLSLDPAEGNMSTLRWDQVGFRDKVAFFNLWNLWMICGDIALIIAALIAVAPGTEELDRAHHDIDSQQLSRSVGTFFVMFSLVKWMEHYLEFYMLVIAVRNSVVRVIKFVIMVLPFYVGYCMVGLLVFYTEEDLFGTLWQTSRTLFALLNGDSILLVYQTLCLNSDYGYCAFAQFYLYSFCIIFIVVVLNVFIFIIETGYEKAQRGTGNHDEEDVVLDFDRVSKILDAADDRGGLPMGRLLEPVTSSTRGSVINALEAEFTDPHRDPPRAHAGGGGAAVGSLDVNYLEARIDYVVRAALAAHVAESHEVTALRTKLESASARVIEETTLNQSLREAMEEEYKREMAKVLEENAALREQVALLRKRLVAGTYE